MFFKIRKRFTNVSFFLAFEKIYTFMLSLEIKKFIRVFINNYNIKFLHTHEKVEC